MVDEGGRYYSYKRCVSDVDSRHFAEGRWCLNQYCTTYIFRGKIIEDSEQSFWQNSKIHVFGSLWLPRVRVIFAREYIPSKSTNGLLYGMGLKLITIRSHSIHLLFNILWISSGTGW